MMSSSTTSERWVRQNGRGGPRIELDGTTVVCFDVDGNEYGRLDPILAYFIAQSMEPDASWFAQALREATDEARERLTEAARDPSR